MIDPFAEMGLSATAAEEKMKIHAKEKKKAPQMDWIKKYELFSNFWGGPSQGPGPDCRDVSSSGPPGWTGFCTDVSLLYLIVKDGRRDFFFYIQSRFSVLHACAEVPTDCWRYTPLPTYVLGTNEPLHICLYSHHFFYSFVYSQRLFSHRSGRMLFFYIKKNIICKYTNKSSIAFKPFLKWTLWR